MASTKSPAKDPCDTRTRQVAKASSGPAHDRIPALTILGHPEISRVGERALLAGLTAGEIVPLSRTAPRFSARTGGAARPLADPFLSREPLASITRDGARIRVERGLDSAAVRVDGADVRDAIALGEDQLDRGAVVELGGRVVLLLHRAAATEGRRPPSFDLVGESDAMHRLRRDIARVAATDLRVLVRGETGSGKELVARAIHSASARAKGPYIAVNMGAVQTSLAASALFGHVRGAFSGAVGDHEGHFAAASGGTLFLDEVGDTDASVQAMLLRALETGEVQRVGDRRVSNVDVRLLSATDADLEVAVAAGRFREPLLHRIGELTLRVPPLRERRDDLGRLVVHFLRELLDAREQTSLLDGEIAERPWLSAAVIAKLARAPWSGNVRQLRNVVRQLVVLGREEAELTIDAEIDRALSDARGAEDARPQDIASRAASGSRPKGKRPQDLSEDEILDALAKSGWKRAAAADLLGIARSSLYTILASNERLVRSRDLTREQIDAALARNDGDRARAAEELRVSEHAIKLRQKDLGGR